MLEKLLKWDRDTFVYLNGLGIEDYDLFWATVTNFSTWIPLFILFLILFFLKFPKKEALYMFLTVLGLAIFITLITHITKISVARLRPNNTEEINTLIRILKSPTDYSFFSGHASSSFSITTLIFLFLRKKVKWSVLFFIWPVVFTLSRVYVGVHYPFDILVGMVVGLLSGWLFYWLYQRFIAPYSMSVHP
ncbi:phosphoesterase PA-phosphatase-related protein [Allomuricauda ruestringensis DSM 13258]|uniref:Phosphoesterase PA-phosphatase-related protein n=1 Tax=Allomuricauda ruestringensis (strain DSM 13258 / CIP 107369 / LMG 19739 / B1) TaxID=886377 RepID=G2PLN1_ALLRU|nr:phosphatase PAP2 family protein [Allomuricauda ruestringensis]AEM71118.1 phosphoesterase PA-phosphatase-related protein [Allomuricauda ruestringensis DSM 13258]